MASNPFSAFANCYANTSGYAHWAAPQEADQVAELRKAVNNTDWQNLYAEGCTRNLVASSWSASEERCEKLQSLCASSGAKNVLEIGSFCGVASLAMAECIPQNGHILSLEIDPYIVNFGQDIKAHSSASKKIDHMVGDALKSLKTLAEKTSEDTSTQPFDFVVIDADKAAMLEYFQLLWNTPGMLTEDATVCIDITPFKCQLFVPYVKGKMDDWIVKSGQESIDACVSVVRDLSGIELAESAGLVVAQRCK